MPTIAPDYLDQLGLPANAQPDEIAAALAAREARCRVLIKIPVKRAAGEAQLALIATVRRLLESRPSDHDYFDFPSDLEPDPFMPFADAGFRSEFSEERDTAPISVDTIIEAEKIEG